MSVAIELWFENLRKNKLFERKEPRTHRLDEVSIKGSQQTFDYMAANGESIQTEFDELFAGGALRKIIPMESTDTTTLMEIVDVLVLEGWTPDFSTKMIKQKRQRLAAAGGGEYFQQREVASLDLKKEFDYTIPAGPRKGETIKKTNKTTMTRAIANSVKFKRLRPELLQWWSDKQTYYTNDPKSADFISGLFTGGNSDKRYKILISRHPVDVLRMSDVGRIRSCHSEDGGWFHCAVEESKGNGLIAYLVDTHELNQFLNPDGADPLDSAQDIVKKDFLDVSTIRRALVRRMEREADPLVSDPDAPAHLQFATFVERLKSDSFIKKLLQQNPNLRSPQAAKAMSMDDFVKAANDGWDWAVPLSNKTQDDINALAAIYDLITPEMVKGAVTALSDGKRWPTERATQLRPFEWQKYLRELNKKEIFRDKKRDIPGISAAYRVRLRKFYDKETGEFFTAPEHRMYPSNPPERFHTAVQEWAWESQKEIFISPDDPDVLDLPEQDALVRLGGSWSDTPDSEVLNGFFSMSGTDINIYRGEVEHEYDEDQDGTGAAVEEMESQLEEILNALNNKSIQVSFEAEVEHDPFGGDDNDPYVHGDASVGFEFELGWGKDADGNEIQPDLRDYDDDVNNKLIAIVDDAGSPEEDDQLWGIVKVNRPIPAPLDHPQSYLPNLVPELHVSFRWRMDEGTGVDDYESFAEYIYEEIDEKYADLHSRIRKVLVTAEFIAPNEFDLLEDDIVEQSKKLKNWSILGINLDDGEIDDDGEAWFTFTPNNESQIELGPLPLALGVSMTVLRNIFGSEGEGKSGIAPRADDYTIGSTRSRRDALIPAPIFLSMLKEKLQPLVDAANVSAGEQLEFDFGEKYKRKDPEPEPTDFVDINHVHIRFYRVAGSLYGRPAGTDAPSNILFSMKIILKSGMSKEEIQGALIAMGFIDQYPAQVHQAVADTYQFFVQRALKIVNRKKETILDGSLMKSLAGALETKYEKMAMDGEDFSEQVMLVVMFIKQNWEKFLLPEKEVAVDFLTVLQTPGAFSMQRVSRPWDLDHDIPTSWNEEVSRKGLQLGVFTLRNQRIADYKWKGPPLTAPKPTSKEKEPEVGAPSPRARRIMTLWDFSAPIAMNMDTEILRWPWADQVEMENALRQDDRTKFMSRLVLSNWDPSILEGHRKTQNSELKEAESSRPVRNSIDLRIYKVALGCIINLDVAGTDSQIENQIRGIKEVTTVTHQVAHQKTVTSRRLYRVYEIKFELLGLQARNVYRDSSLVPAINRLVNGVKVVNRGPVQKGGKLHEWGGLGYSAPAPNRYEPKMVTPRVSLDAVVDDWSEGGVQIYDTPMNTNQMQYHVMMDVDELWSHAARFYRGNKTDFDGRYKHFIKDGPQMPVYVAVGQNGRVKITGNEDLIWFAKESGLQELPVFFSYQKQV